jgi:hypothetical protein
LHCLQHRDTKENNLDVHFEFTPENLKVRKYIVIKYMVMSKGNLFLNVLASHQLLKSINIMKGTLWLTDLAVLSLCTHNCNPCTSRNICTFVCYLLISRTEKMLRFCSICSHQVKKWKICKLVSPYNYVQSEVTWILLLIYNQNFYSYVIESHMTPVYLT